MKWVLILMITTGGHETSQRFPGYSSWERCEKEIPQVVQAYKETLPRTNRKKVSGFCVKAPT